MAANYAEFARLYITQHVLHKIHVVHAYLGSLLVLEKTPDGAKLVSLTGTGGE